MRDIPIHDDSADRTHRLPDDPDFQETALFVWNDLAAGVGGFWRLGQQVNRQRLYNCFGIFTADGLRFRANADGAPMVPGDRGEAHMAWGSNVHLDMERLAITVRFPDCEADLRFEDFFPRYHFGPLLNRTIHAAASAAHFEVAGRMTGRIRIGDREVAVDALGYRDRSWGPKRWGTMRSTRWWPCVFGPDLCAFSTASVHETGEGGINGYVVKDGVPLAMAWADQTVTLDADAVGPRAGHLRFRLENGEEGEIAHERQDGIVMMSRNRYWIESIGTARWGDRIGMSNFEVHTNPAGGDKPPVMILNANNGQGLSRR